MNQTSIWSSEQIPVSAKATQPVRRAGERDRGQSHDLRPGQSQLSPRLPHSSLSGWGDDVYLLTWFCDNADFALSTVGGVTYSDLAEVCVRVNVDSEPSSSDSASGRHRKFLRSQAYSNNLVWNSVNYINWNLSCPDKSGLASSASYLTCCSTAVEPTTNDACQSQSNIWCLGAVGFVRREHQLHLQRGPVSWRRPTKPVFLGSLRRQRFSRYQHVGHHAGVEQLPQRHRRCRERRMWPGRPQHRGLRGPLRNPGRRPRPT